MITKTKLRTAYHTECLTHLSVIPQDLAPYIRRLPDFTGPVPQSLLISDQLFSFQDYNTIDSICQVITHHYREKLRDLLQRTAAIDGMLDSVLHLSTLRVVETIDGTDQITGDAADTLEGNVVIGVAHVDILTVYGEGHGGDHLIGILLLELLYIRVDFCF